MNHSFVAQQQHWHIVHACEDGFSHWKQKRHRTGNQLNLDYLSNSFFNELEAAEITWLHSAVPYTFA